MILPWVPETFRARFPRRSWLRSTTEAVSAFGPDRKFPPHARKTSGTLPRVEWYRLFKPYLHVCRARIRVRHSAGMNFGLMEYQALCRHINGLLLLWTQCYKIYFSSVSMKDSVSLLVLTYRCRLIRDRWKMNYQRVSEPELIKEKPKRPLFKAV